MLSTHSQQLLRGSCSFFRVTMLVWMAQEDEILQQVFVEAGLSDYNRWSVDKVNQEVILAVLARPHVWSIFLCPKKVPTVFAL